MCPNLSLFEYISRIVKRRYSLVFSPAAVILSELNIHAKKKWCVKNTVFWANNKWEYQGEDFKLKLNYKAVQIRFNKYNYNIIRIKCTISSVRFWSVGMNVALNWQIRGHHIAKLDPLGINSADLDDRHPQELLYNYYSFGKPTRLRFRLIEGCGAVFIE